MQTFVFARGMNTIRNQSSTVNILYIHTHDTGRYLGSYGHEVHTPELDAFAGQAVRFPNAHSVAPTCSPSRSGLLTSTYPHENGMLGLAHRGFSLRDYSLHLVTHLKSLGYTTALCGVQHVAPNKSQIGYDRILDDEVDYFQQDITDLESYDRGNAERAARFLMTPPADPFFLSFGMLNTHRPFPGRKQEYRHNLKPPGYIPDTELTRADAAGFYASVETVDACAGMVLDALAHSGREADTLVIFTTDHGPPFPGMKATLTDGGTGVALLLRPPGGRNLPQVVDSMVSHLDLFPTICELTNSRPPHQLRGRSLLPLIRGETISLHSYLFSEINFHAAYEPTRAVRSERYKLIRHFPPHSHRLAVNVDDSASKDLFHARGYFSKPIEEYEFYDLHDDPGERKNRISDPAYSAEIQELLEALSSWMSETSDPLLQGPIEAPPGAILNSPDAYSPESRDFE
jgi:arylsulfatase A-like enzyme